MSLTKVLIGYNLDGMQKQRVMNVVPPATAH